MQQRGEGVVQLGERRLVAATGAAQQRAERILRVGVNLVVDGASAQCVTKHAAARVRHHSQFGHATHSSPEPIRIGRERSGRSVIVSIVVERKALIGEASDVNTLGIHATVACHNGLVSW